MQKLETLTADKLNWKLNFTPLRKWPDYLPVLVVCAGDQLVVVAGFEREVCPEISTLIAPGDLTQVFVQCWGDESLGTCEKLRASHFLSIFLKSQTTDSTVIEPVLTWPIEFQNFLDGKQISLKNLRPLKFLNEWQSEMTKLFLTIQPSSSHIREILDLLCDLKLAGSSWQTVFADFFKTEPLRSAPDLVPRWLTHLKKLRLPQATTFDKIASNSLLSIAWPKGVQAKWERQGDQSGIHFQTRLSNHKEWLRLKSQIEKLEIEEKVWPCTI